MEHEIETFDPDIHIKADEYQLTLKPSEAIELRATLNSALEKLGDPENKDEENRAEEDTHSESSLEETLKTALPKEWSIRTIYTDQDSNEDHIIVTKESEETVLSINLGRQLKEHGLAVRAAGKTIDNQSKLSIGWQKEI